MEERAPTPDEQIGMAWWNNLTVQQRSYWMAAAGHTGIAADAWQAYKSGQAADSFADAKNLERKMQ